MVYGIEYEDSLCPAPTRRCDQCGAELELHELTERPKALLFCAECLPEHDSEVKESEWRDGLHAMEILAAIDRDVAGDIGKMRSLEMAAMIGRVRGRVLAAKTLGLLREAA
jgi:hypothetical protein